VKTFIKTVYFYRLMVFNKDKDALFGKYLIHAFLQNFTLYLFFAYGALLLYEKTSSILLILLFGIVMKATRLLVKSIGIHLWIPLANKIGLRTTVLWALLFRALAFIILFYISSSNNYFLYLFFLASILQGIGGAVYFSISGSLLWNMVGSTKLPGKYSAINNAVVKGAAILASLSGFLFVGQNSFLWLFILAAIFLVISVFPLKGFKLEKIEKPSFIECLKSISLQTFIANISPPRQLKDVALPLIILFAFSSLSTSVWISGGILIATIIFSFVAGHFKDLGKKTPSIIALIAVMAIWIAFGFVKSPIMFLTLGALLGIFNPIIGIGRASRMSREISNRKKPLQSAIAVEFARSIGQMIAYATLIIAFIFTNTIPQFVLILNALFILPSGLYAIGKIDSKKA
jgi:MFS family permease